MFFLFASTGWDYRDIGTAVHGCVKDRRDVFLYLPLPSPEMWFLFSPFYHGVPLCSGSRVPRMFLGLPRSLAPLSFCVCVRFSDGSVVYWEKPFSFERKRERDTVYFNTSPVWVWPSGVYVGSECVKRLLVPIPVLLFFLNRMWYYTFRLVLHARKFLLPPSLQKNLCPCPSKQIATNAGLS